MIYVSYKSLHGCIDLLSTDVFRTKNLELEMIKVITLLHLVRYYAKHKLRVVLHSVKK